MALESAADMTVVGEAAAVTDAVRCIRATRPTVIVMGPANDGGAATAVRAIREQSPIPVLVLGTGVERDAVVRVLAAGARGYVHRGTPPFHLAAAVRSVAVGALVLGSSAAESVIEELAAAPPEDLTAELNGRDKASLAALTPRQHEVLHLVAEGLPNAEIAGRMQVSVATVKSHVSGLLQKLDARDRTQLAVMAYHKGLAR
jgi:DNA-binding NarL/FixJ family response regulator